MELSLSTELESGISEALAEARRRGRTVAPPPGWPPVDEASATRIREHATRLLGEEAAGYKIGATSPEAQRIIGCDGPFHGPLLSGRVHPSGTVLSLPEGALGLECEFAFRIGRDQRDGEDGWSRDSVAGLVESCHPALEIIGARVAAEGFPGLTGAVADFGLNVAFVHGPAIPDWRNHDLAAATVRGLVDGRETNAGAGGNVLGHPLNALAWLANVLAAEGGGLREGDWVSTGTCLGVVPVAAGAHVVGDYGPLGSVSVRFAG